ncbi:MAG TPA: hypothetical protein VFB62_22770 [Polyangiaceae bacterium]|jgi:hypothetical protein|nr:hypothetical protein [Polyangiaceae bacterium]
MRFVPMLILLAACNGGRQPLPGGPPPEYEPPRSYEPKTNIDKPGSEPDAIDKLLEDKAPAPEGSAPEPETTPPPPEGSAPKPAPK